MGRRRAGGAVARPGGTAAQPVTVGSLGEGPAFTNDAELPISLTHLQLTPFPTAPHPATTPPLTFPASPSAWRLALRVDATAYVVGRSRRPRVVADDPARLTYAEALDLNVEEFDAPTEWDVSVLSDPAVTLRPSLELVHRSGAYAAARAAVGSRRLDLSVRRDRLLYVSTEASLGYRRRLGRWTPYAYAVVGHARQQRLRYEVLAEAGASRFELFADAGFDDAAFLADLDRGAVSYTAAATQSVAERSWLGATSLGGGLGVDVQAHERWQLGLSAERLFERGSVSLGARIRL